MVFSVEGVWCFVVYSALSSTSFGDDDERFRVRVPRSTSASAISTAVGSDDAACVFMRPSAEVPGRGGVLSCPLLCHGVASQVVTVAPLIDQAACSFKPGRFLFNCLLSLVARRRRHLSQSGKIHLAGTA